MNQDRNIPHCLYEYEYQVEKEIFPFQRHNITDRERFQFILKIPNYSNFCGEEQTRQVQNKQDEVKLRLTQAEAVFFCRNLLVWVKLGYPLNFNFLGKPLLGEKYVEGRKKKERRRIMPSLVATMSTLACKTCSLHTTFAPIIRSKMYQAQILFFQQNLNRHEMLKKAVISLPFFFWAKVRNEIYFHKQI